LIELVVGSGRTGALRLLADGVVLNPGLPEEPMPRTLHALAQALVSLARGKGTQAIELPRAKMLWLLEPRGEEVALRWYVRGSAGARVREARVDLRGLGQATAAALVRVPATARLRKQLGDLQPPSDAPEPLAGFELRAEAAPVALRVRVERVPALHGSVWRSLLAPGRLELLDARGTLASLDGPPLLALEALARWAHRGLHPARGNEPLQFSSGGALALEHEAVRLGHHSWPELGPPLASAVGELCSAWAQAMSERVPAVARSAPVRALVEDAAVLIAGARQKPIAARAGAKKAKPARRPRPAEAVASGSVRKLSFELLFKARVPFAPRQLYFVGERVLALGAQGAALVAIADGAVRWKERVRAAALGKLVLGVDSHDRLLRLDLATGAPRWFRDSEGVDPLALLTGPPGLCVLVEPDALSGRFTETGLAAWHFRPPMGERVFATPTREHLFATTAGGQLASLDPLTGEPHFRALAPRPFRQAPVLRGDSLLLLLEGQPSDELLIAESASGSVRRVVPLGLRDAGPLVALGDCAATLGRTGEGWTLAIFNLRGQTRHLVPTGFTGRRAPALAATDDGLLACADDGRVRLYDEAGALRFSDDEPASASTRTLAPVLARKLALVASDRPALYDLHGRRQLARLPKMDGLCAMAADDQLRVVVADDSGHLRGYRLRGHLAVVPDAG